MRRQEGPVPTIGELLEPEPHWMWVYCEAVGCHYGAPFALAQAVIRWGPD